MCLNPSFKSTCIVVDQYFLEKQRCCPAFLSAIHVMGSWGSGCSQAHEAASGWLMQEGAGNVGGWK